MFAAREWHGVMILVAIAAGYFFRARWLCLPATWLNVGEAPQPADYILILDGDRIARPPVAVALYRAGLAKKILVSQVDRVPARDVQHTLPANHEICRELLRQGIPAEDIRMVGNHNQSTYDEARALAEYLPPDSQASVIVVTNDYHTRRVHWIFNQLLGPRGVRLSAVSAHTKDFIAERWWETEAGRHRVVDENLKLGYYLVRYGRVAALATGVVATLPLLLLQRQPSRRRRDEPAASLTPLGEYRSAS